jgi:6-pyruvoyltetrahydropterin/6-carboxytetrahydropterin synthase
LYEIQVGAHFDAAHYLRDYQGPCSRMHGHTWRVEAAVIGSELGPSQLVIDFHDLKALLEEVIAPFDHSCLNEVEPFTELSPTSETLARFIYGKLEEKLHVFTPQARLSWVSVSESPDTQVVYSEEV